MQYNKISKENIDHLLFEVAKEYHKHGRKAKGEIVIVGGAAIVANYEFRNMSEDADAIFYAESHLKDAITKVARDHNLPDNWLNSDFIITRSYSDKLGRYAVPYKTFANSIEVKLIDKEYLIAMKLASFRKYKNDISDMVGILCSEYNKGNDILLKDIKQAIINLYGSYDYIEEEARRFIENITIDHKYLISFDDIVEDEKLSNSIINNSNTIFNNISDINIILSKTKNKRLSDLYAQLGIELTDDMNRNAQLAQKQLISNCSSAKTNMDINDFIKDYFKELYFLHSDYLKGVK